MIADYCVVVGDAVDIPRLTEEVKRLIDQGWEPVGGICKDAGTLLQVMVRTKPTTISIR